MSQRRAKVESVIRQVVAPKLAELSSSPAAVTVTGVDVAPDLRNATIWVAILGAESQRLMTELIEELPQLQRALAAAMTTKFVPKLHLKLDTGSEHAERIGRLLR